MWGGRLGTNLVELHLMDLDGLSRVIGRQHGLPAAFARHFEAADPDLQRLLPPELAARYACVPLRRVDDRIAIASIAPLDGRARAIVADQLRISYKGLVPAIAPELRIRYHLERVYGIPRDTRFLRPRKYSQLPSFEIQLDADDSDPGVAPTPPTAEEPSDAIPEELLPDFTPRIEVEPPTADRRHYIRTLGDEPAAALGRIELKRQAIAAAALPVVAKSPMTLDDATLAIRRSTDRTAIAHRVIETVARFVSARAAVLLVVRGDAATSWTGFSRTGQKLPEIAVPLDRPNLVASVLRDKAVSRSPGENPIDLLLLHTLGEPDGELVIAPIEIGAHVWCMIALASERGAAVDNLVPISAAASVAFTRLLRQANR